jgi:nucleotide-binding universal stress UspA family protein
MKLLIGFDGSEPAKTAIGDLLRAGLPESGVNAEVICVAEVYPPLPPDCFEAPLQDDQDSTPAIRKAHQLARIALAEANTLAHRGAEVVRTSFQGWRVTTHACGGSPYHEIIERASQTRPDLIVLGSHGRGALGRALFGSVAQKVLAYAPCSVRIGRHKPSLDKWEPLRLLIGFDDSDGANSAVRTVAARTWPARTEVVIATALDVQTTGAISQVLASPASEAAARVEENAWITGPIARAKRALERSGLEVSSYVDEDSPRHLIVREAQERGIDCVFVGARGLNRIERFLIGSVSSTVAARLHCSVEVVRQP